MRERYEFRVLRSDFGRSDFFIVSLFNVESVDFWSATVRGGRWTWVVRVGTGGETLAWEDWTCQSGRLSYDYLHGKGDDVGGEI